MVIVKEEIVASYCQWEPDVVLVRALLAALPVLELPMPLPLSGPSFKSFSFSLLNSNTPSPPTKMLRLLNGEYGKFVLHA